MNTTRRLGLVVPSSNTVVEPEVRRLLAGVEPPAEMFVSRLRVTEIGLGEQAVSAFGVVPMAQAAALLGDLRPDAVAWAGTSGAWLGLAHDRRVVATLTEAAGAPATTAMLAVVDACRSGGLERIGLVTPYTTDVVDRVLATMAGEGLAVVAERHLGITDNAAFADVGEAAVADLVEACATDAAQAVVVLCTNLRAAARVDELTDRLGVPVVDSVVATVYHLVTLAGVRPVPVGRPGSPAAGPSGRPTVP